MSVPAYDCSQVRLSDVDRSKRRSLPRRSCMLAFCLLAIGPGMPLSVFAEDRPTPRVSPDHLRFFEEKIRPLLIERCYDCHSAESGEANGELLIDTAAGVRTGGSLGPLVTPGDPDNSLLLRAVNYRDSKLQMPPDGKLDDASIDALRQWIKIGAPDPRIGESVDLPESVSPLDRDPQTHWAFNLPHPAVPETIAAGSRDVIDAVAEAKASSQGIDSNRSATREVLIRRLYYDLTGFPPSSEEIARFVASDRPDAYTRLVDRLLASPEFGHRFGRHWLDVARYADTVGYALAGRERRYEGSERYRDWTIHAFATDIPYDEMVRHQLAGDRTDPTNEQGNLDAMGFLTLGRKFLSQFDTIDDRIDVISRGLLGLTVTCARCHDHKFDPIPTSDYYSLGGIIFSSEQPKDGVSPLMLVDKPKPVDSPVLIRGQIGNRGPIAPRQYLTALRKEGEPRFSDGSGRWELAQRVASSDNPLTARVMVNRIWGHLIGKPLVSTPSDFGFRTEPPAVQEVLDDLSHEFSQHWSVKRIVRRIVMTRIYRQSSDASRVQIERDPDNQYLARANRRRRDFESLRDSMLGVSGLLDRSLGGPPVEITRDTPNPRQTIYALIDRQNLPSLFRTFDFANPDAHSPKRYFTTVPQQALYLLNNRQILQLARHTANEVRRTSPSARLADRVDTLFHRVLGREPTADQRRVAVAFLQQPPSKLAPQIDARTLLSYGIAGLTDKGGITEFKPLSEFRNDRWQVSEKFPESPPWGHAYLSSQEGHTPNDTSLAVVRRFKAPMDGFVELRGQMGHRNKKGDGVLTSIWIGGKRVFRGTQKSNNRPYGPLSAHILSGQTVDLVAAPGSSDQFDTFYWRAKIKLVGDDGRTIEADTVKHFSGPFDPQSSQPLGRLAQLAQALLLSNEFTFVD